MIDWALKIANALLEAKHYADQKLANLVQLVPFSRVSAGGEGDAGDTRPSSKPGQAGFQRIQHAGFRSTPLPSTTGVQLLVEGGGSKRVTVAEDDGGQGPTLDTGG